MTRSPLPAAALALALSLSACGGDAETPSAQSPAGAVTPVPTAPTPTGSAGASAPTAAAASPTPSVVVPGPSPSDDDPTAAPGAPAPTSARSAAAAPAVSPAAASRATRAGRYTYDSRGTVTAGAAPRSFSGTSTLTVDPAVKDTQSLVLEGDQGRTETDTVLRGDGRYVARLLLTTPAFSKEFRLAPPALLVPTPAEVGRTWSFTAKSTDGKTTVSANNRVVRAEDVTVGGRRVATRVVETRLSLRGDIVYDGTTTTHYAPEQRLAVKERGTGRGTVSGVAFSTDTSSALRSVEPA